MTLAGIGETERCLWSRHCSAILGDHSAFSCASPPAALTLTSKPLAFWFVMRLSRRPGRVTMFALLKLGRFGWSEGVRVCFFIQFRWWGWWWGRRIEWSERGRGLSGRVTGFRLPPGDAIRLLYELRQAIITVLLLYSQHHYSTKLWAQLWLIATIIHMYVYKGTSYSRV